MFAELLRLRWDVTLASQCLHRAFEESSRRVGLAVVVPCAEDGRDAFVFEFLIEDGGGTQYCIVIPN